MTGIFDWLAASSAEIAVLANLATILGGGAAFAALFIVPQQLGLKKKADDNRADLKLMVAHYRRYMASDEGIVWGSYPQDAKKIIAAISRDTRLAPDRVKSLLDEMIQKQ